QADGHYEFSGNHYDLNNRILRIKNLTTEKVSFSLKIEAFPETKQEAFFTKFIWQQSNSHQNNFIGVIKNYNSSQPLYASYDLEGNEEVFVVLPEAKKIGGSYNNNTFSNVNVVFTVTADRVYTVSQHYQLGY